MAQVLLGSLAGKKGDYLAPNLPLMERAMHTMHMGPDRPSYAVAGMLWIKETVPNPTLQYFDGVDDIQIFEVTPDGAVISGLGVTTGTTPNVNDLNTQDLPSGWFSWNAAAAGTPITGRGGYGIQVRRFGGAIEQAAQIGFADSEDRMFVRLAFGGAYRDWFEVGHSGNAAAVPKEFGAVGTSVFAEWLGALPYPVAGSVVSGAELSPGVIGADGTPTVDAAVVLAGQWRCMCAGGYRGFGTWARIV